MRKTLGALILLLWGGCLIVTGVATGNPEPAAKYAATGTTQLVFGLAFGIALFIIGGAALLASRRRGRNA